jgi:hypothetical protein
LVCRAPAEVVVGEDVGALVGETVVGEAVGEVVVGHAAPMLVFETTPVLVLRNNTPPKITRSSLGRLPHKPRLLCIHLNKQNTETEMAQCYRKTK